MSVAHRLLREEIRPLDVVVSIVVMWVFAIAQPLLDLLGRNAEFFLARSAPALDIVVLAVVLTIVAPLLLVGVVLIVGLLHTATGNVLHALVLIALGSVFGIQIIDMLPGSPSSGLEILMSVAIGLGVTAAYFRYDPVRLGARYASVAPFVVLGLFLFASSTSQLVFAAPAIAQPAEIDVAEPAPVVMVVFDEFPVASLMDADGAIQADVYPNFARLADDATWFRNAVTIQQQTENSIPAMLSGRNSSGNKIPTAADHPFTLFTLLADRYDLNVHESVTDLCPEYACANETRPTAPTAERWETLVDDLRIVAGHLFLPNDMTSSLPPIDASWSNFSGTEDTSRKMVLRFQEQTYSNDRRDAIANFIGSLDQGGGDPRLSYMHALVPHVPWEYLPSGQTYNDRSGAPGSKSPGWGPDVWLVDQGYQRHLLMVQYVDGVLGRILDKLQAEGTYDESLIIVIADHGVAVRPNIEHRRVITDDTIGDIAAIPLFIKQPNQTSGVIDDYRALTLDVLPTIADVLGVDVPWSVDGASLFADDRPVRKESVTSGSKGDITFGVDGSEARDLARRKVEHFGPDGAFGLAPSGYRGLLGMAITDATIDPRGATVATLADVGAYQSVDVDGATLPTWVHGSIEGDGATGDDLIVAVAVNGVIEAITRTYRTEDGGTAYGAMVPPDALVAGPNDIRLLLVDDTFHMTYL